MEEKERLLFDEVLDILKKGYMCGSELSLACMQKLASYENTNLSPEEVEELKKENEELKAIAKNKILNLKSNEFIKLCLKCGVMVKAEEKSASTKLAVEKLEELSNKFKHTTSGEEEDNSFAETYNYVVDEIKTEINRLLADLKGGK